MKFVSVILIVILIGARAASDWAVPNNRKLRISDSDSRFADSDPDSDSDFKFHHL